MKKTLLICDDDEDILELCRVILSQDFQVVTINNTKSILDTIERSQPSLILMDLWIPPNGGAKMTATLKKHDISKRIPLILFSANDEIEKICTTVKADGYIKKPFSVKKMKTYINEILTREDK